MDYRTKLIGLVMILASSIPANADEKIAFGEYLSGECVTCHQISGEDKGIPSIVGWDPESFVAVMTAYKNKELENKVMVTIAGALSDDETVALAAYFETIKPKE